MTRYERRFNVTLDEDTRMGALCQLLPAALQEHSYNLAPTPGLSTSQAADKKITKLQEQTQRKQTMPRFFKFEESPGQGTDNTGEQGI